MKSIYTTCLLFIIGFYGCGPMGGGGAISTSDFSEIFTNNLGKTYFKMTTKFGSPDTYFVEANKTIKKISHDEYIDTKLKFYSEQNIDEIKKKVQEYISSVEYYTNIESYYIHDDKGKLLSDKFLIMIDTTKEKSNEYEKSYKLLLVSKNEKNYDIKQLSLPPLKKSTFEDRRYFKIRYINIENKRYSILYSLSETGSSFEEKLREAYVFFYETTTKNISMLPLYQYIHKYTDKDFQSFYKISFSLGKEPIFLLNEKGLVKLEALGNNPQNGSTLRYVSILFNDEKTLTLSVPTN